ncbi:ribonuclease H-like domain-containing protein, partial [Tanacetum coccineum]
SCNKEKLPVLCHACQLGKYVKLSFVSSSNSVTSCFDIVHSDLWTSPIQSLSGFQYYVLSKFLLFCNYVRTQFKCEIKSFQCDHGGEFDNHAFHKLFNDNGIQFRFSCPRTSQQNGKSKRMIRIINNLIRTLLFQAHLPPNYWTEALNMAVYLLNILPSRANNNEIPFTRLFGAQPDYSVLHVFGCLCYPYIDTNHKLGPRATPSIFLGHAANHFGYRCLDLNTNNISRHVTFDETVFPFPSTKSTTRPFYNFLDDSTDLISTIIRTAPITPVPAPVHTLLVDVPTPPTPPPPPTPQSMPPNYTESNWGMVDNSVCCPTLYRSLADSLQYLTFTRPDITYAVQQACLYMHDPREPHFSALKRILRAEAEYRGVANVVAETCWIRNLLRELHTPLSSATIVYCDNYADIFIKGLPSALFDEFRDSLSVRCTPASTAGEC